MVKLMEQGSNQVREVENSCLDMFMYVKVYKRVKENIEVIIKKRSRIRFKNNGLKIRK